MPDDERPFIPSSDIEFEDHLQRIEDIKEREIQRKEISIIVKGIPLLKRKGAYPFSTLLHNVFLSKCFNCNAFSVWIHDRLVYPKMGLAPLANPDLSDDILKDYHEASSILSLSPRGAAALLRVAIQKLFKELGLPGKDLNKEIGKLVAKGLDAETQRALDVVRVTGNAAVHPGQMDLRDDEDTAKALFGLVNFIAEKMISTPRHLDEVYKSLPTDKIEQIEKRDAKKLSALRPPDTLNSGIVPEEEDG